MNLIKKIKSFAPDWLVVSFAFLVVTFLAYGLFFWRLGFYWDGQAISWIYYQFGPEATVKYFSDSRPVWGLLYQVTSFVLPPKPAYWQLFAMFWRWAGVFSLWLVLEKLFPRRKNITLLLSFFFLLYPGFNQQWVSYLYAHFFIVLFFLLISWVLMLHGKTVLAMIFSALNLLMLEYFFPLELIRPVIIFKSLQDEPLSVRDRYLKTLKLWLPYLGVIVAVVLYRVLVFSHPGFGYSLTDELVRNPGVAITHLLTQIFSSFWITLVAAWFQVFQFPNPSVVGMRTSILYVVIVLIVSVFILFIKRIYDSQSELNSNKHDRLWLIMIGAILLALGGIPFWVTDLPVSLGFPANRATLSFMLGVSFFLMGLIEFLPIRAKYLVAVVLISLSAGRQYLWSVDYVRDWNSQKNFFWQMIWRAPGLEPGTIVLTNQQLSYNADNSISPALNWIYAPDNHSSRVDYVLFYPTNRLEGALAGLEPDIPVRYDYLAGQFEGNTSQTVVFYYAPPGCLRLLDPEIDPFNRLIPVDSLLREAAKLSSTAPILNETVARMPEIYNPEPSHSWCYYFEQADLARQMENWEEVADLGNKAFKLDDYPNDPLERFVFVEGYAHMGEWDKALDYAQISYKVSKSYVGPLLCRLWGRIDREVPNSPEKDDYVTQAKTLFVCNP